MLLDTGGLYCYLDAVDARHRRAVSLMDLASRRVTHNYILAELVALCNARGIDRRITFGFVTGIAQDPAMKLEWIGKDEHRAGIDLLRARPDRDCSLCDAIRFIVMRQHGITEALTTDHHFEQEGFVRLLPP